MTPTDDMATSVAPEPLTTLARNAIGRLVHPGDTDYDGSRLGWNRTIDPHPAAVLHARSPRDVQLAVETARGSGIDLAVQATGHGTLVPADDALVVRTTDMDHIDVDPHSRLARVGPGVTWHQLNAVAGRYGLGSLAGRCGTVGVTGYTLGGGAAWLSRTYGYAANSVTAAEVVLANGSLVAADHDLNPELFWGLRGGGGNFGIVTSLSFRLFPAERVFGGMSFYPAETAEHVLGAYRQWADDEPEGMNTAILLMRLPATAAIPEPLRGRQVVALRVFTLAEESFARRQVAPLLAAAGEPLHDGLAVRSFEAASRATNGPDVPPVPHRQLFHHYDALPDELLHTLVSRGFHAGSPFAFVELRHWEGAMAEPGPDAGPAGHRTARYSVLAVAPYPSGSRSRVDGEIDEFDRSLCRTATGAGFLNLLTEPHRTTTAFTPDNLTRLRQLKRSVDPTELFRPSHHIHPI